MTTIRDETDEHSTLVADWLERIGVETLVVWTGPACTYQDEYMVIFKSASTPLRVTVQHLGVPRYSSLDHVVFYALEWIADGLNSADQPDYEHFLSSFGFEDDSFAQSFWRFAVEGRTFFDAILGENMHQEVHCLTALAGGVDDDTLEYTLNFLKGEN